MRDHLGITEAIYKCQGVVVKLLARSRPQESDEWKDFIWSHHHCWVDWWGWNPAILTHLFLSSCCDKLACETPASQLIGLLQMKMSDEGYLCDCAYHRTGGGRHGDVIRWKNVFPIQSVYVTDCLLLWSSVRSSQCSNFHILLQCLQWTCPGDTWPWSNSWFCWDNILESCSSHQHSV